MNRIIGITGGIGSGKSSVLNAIAEKYDAYVLEADKVGHEVMLPDGSAYVDVIIEFGTDIVGEDGHIDRHKLGDIVFSDEDKLAKLNAIIHPRVKEEIVHRINDIKHSVDKYIIFIEAALLIEDHYDQICDELWYIRTNYDIRYDRVSRSRKMTKQQFDDVVANQLGEEEYAKKCKVIIDNSGTIEDTMKEIDKALEGIR